MTPGIYLVTFLASSRAIGWGLVVVDQERIHGGDHSYLYRGTYVTTGSAVNASIVVSHYQGELSSVLGPLNTFKLDLSGTHSEKGFVLSGHVEGQPQMAITVQGEKKADLL